MKKRSYGTKPSADSELPIAAAFVSHALTGSIADARLQALLASEARWRALVENTQDWVWEVDKNGRYNYASPQVQELLGYTSEEVLGKTPFDFMPDEERDRVLEIFSSALAHGAPFQGLENINQRKDGSLVVLETNGVPFFDKCGDLAGYRGIGRDITRRKQVETELRRKSEELEGVFSSTHILIAIMDREFNFLRVNRSYAVMAGREEASLIGRNHFELYPHEENEQQFRQVVESGESCCVIARPFEFPDRPGLGITYWDWTLMPIKDEKGMVEGVILTLADATERERQRQAAMVESWEIQAQLEQRVRERTTELEAANRELEAFSYAVSHDLRAPLRTISGFCRALQEDCAGSLDGNGKMYLERIHKAAVRMSEFIEGLLRLSLISQTKLHSMPVDLSTLAHDCIHQLHEQEPARSPDISIEPGLTVIGDAALLRLLLQNLLGNAWKFTSHSAKAKIQFGREHLHGSVVYVVRDNGAGFEMENASKLFQPFMRLHGRDEFEGSGIGLATVRRIVERHGGRVAAEGTPQQGAAFYFTLNEKLEPPSFGKL